MNQGEENKTGEILPTWIVTCMFYWFAIGMEVYKKTLMNFSVGVLKKI